MEEKTILVTVKSRCYGNKGMNWHDEEPPAKMLLKNFDCIIDRGRGQYPKLGCEIKIGETTFYTVEDFESIMKRLL